LFGETFTIIDTPGLDSSPRANLAVLKTIAEKLAEITSGGRSTVSGVIYFHPITDLRLTGPARTQIQILEQICGESFYARTAVVTTMWNRINKEDVMYDKLHENFGRKYPHLTRPNTFFKFLNDKDSAAAVLKRLLAVARSPVPGRPATLQLQSEVARMGTSAGSMRKTQAGKRIESDMDRGFCTIL